MQEEIPKIFIGLLLSVLFILLMATPAIRIISRNREKRKISEHLCSQINKGTINFEHIINEFDFPVATIDTDKNIQQLHSLFLSKNILFETLLGIEAVSSCYKNYFLLIGNFRGHKTIATGRNNFNLLPEEYRRADYERLYIANMLFKIHGNKMLTLLLHEIPEDEDHNFFIKDFIMTLKEILK